MMNASIDVEKKTKTTTKVGVSVKVSGHELWHEIPRRVKMHDNRSHYEDQERRGQLECRGRLHRVASKLLARAANTGAPTVFRHRRHSTPTPVVEEASNVVQEDGYGNGQSNGQSRVSKPSRRKSLLSRARSLRGVKSLSDLKMAARRVEKGKSQCGQDQTGGVLGCAVVRMRSVNSATSAPLYFFGGAE